MACSCQKNKTAPKSYVVKSPDGSTKTYRTEVEATAAARRVGGTWKAQ
jgi:hypothetical protein